MKTVTWTWTGVSLGGLLLVLGAPLVGACSKSSPPPPPPTGGGACTTNPGSFPAPNCDNTDESCTLQTPACPTTPCTSGSPCLAMADNTGASVDDLRLRKLNVTAPPALAEHFIQAGVIDQGVNLKDFCGEGGDGSFSWLIEFDTTNNKVTTGGAPPTDDPFGTGYCFVNQNIGGLPVAPVTVNMTKGADGSWASDVIPKLYVPIYISGDPNNVVVLPLTQSTVVGVTLSPDGNCIGQYNPNGVSSPAADGTCSDQDDSSCERWYTAGALGGFITLKEAEAVQVKTLGKSLCVLLTSGSNTTNGGADCATDANGNVLAQGDYCSTTNAPGGCADSYWLAATFSASAAKITSGSSVAACNGSLAGAGDGGTGGGSSGSGTDAGGD